MASKKDKKTHAKVQTQEAKKKVADNRNRTAAPDVSVDATRVGIEDLSGGNVLAKLTDNEIARSNREVGKLGTKGK